MLAPFTAVFLRNLPPLLLHICVSMSLCMGFPRLFFAFLVATIRLPSYDKNLENMTILASRDGASFAFLGS